MFEQIDAKGVIETYFDSITEWYEAITGEYKTSSNPSWSGYNNKGEAYQASLSSNKYSDKIKQVASELAKQVQMSMPDMQPSLDVTGLGYDVGMALSGVPECWLTMTPSKEPKIVRILYNFGVSAGTSSDIIIARGVAVCALVMCLESSGISTEIIMVADSKPSDRSKETHEGIRFFITFKKSGDYFDLEKFAWGLCDPGMYRSLGTSWIETRTKGHYGYAWLDTKGEGYDLYFKMIHLYDSDFSSLETAKKWVIEKCREFGVEISNPPLA